MITFRMNGLEVKVEEGSTLLDAAKFYGLEIPTLCHNEGLTPFGGCRLCIVEIGEGLKSKLVSSCTYPAEEGLVVRTDTKRVWASRR
ncbi:MAG: 2Fe-2S iron-sulfur cluster-binding protein, partial [Candidatus Aminicenantales bacterium]